MRTFLRLGIDLAWVALSAVLALLIRDNFVLSVPRLQAIIPYIVVCVASAAVVFTVWRLHRTVWRYTSLLDVLHLIAAATIALLLALLAAFAFNRLEDVARAVPVIQWFVLVVALIGTRTVARLREQAERSRTSMGAPAPVQHVLVVGVNDLTELYLSSIAEFAATNRAVVGILSQGRALQGRLMRQYRVLGVPEDISRVLSELELHGVTVDRIVVLQPFEHLSRSAQEALLEVERASAIEVEWLLETLGWRGSESGGRTAQNTLADTVLRPPASADSDQSSSPHGSGYLKRAIDLVSVTCLTLALSPVLALVALIVAIDVGLPLVFWQQRPGRHGRPFRLFKFRTMRPAHDARGNRIPDELRSSYIGRFLRRSRLDELPQLYNILVGEMSFVGPRPLLPIDQPQHSLSRLLIRPGLTGWAQVNGGREISPEDKVALDIWYMMNASLWLDITILWRTLAIMGSGDRVNEKAVEIAHAMLEEITTTPRVEASIRHEPSGAQHAA